MSYYMKLRHIYASNELVLNKEVTCIGYLQGIFYMGYVYKNRLFYMSLCMHKEKRGKIG